MSRNVCPLSVAVVGAALSMEIDGIGSGATGLDAQPIPRLHAAIEAKKRDMAHLLLR